MKNVFLIYLVLASFVLISCEKKVAEYSGEDISTEASIIRNKHTKQAILKINTSEPWVLYAGKSAETIDLSSPIMRGKEGGMFNLNVPNSIRMYFQLEMNRGTAILAERQLPMEGGYNFRDLGGIKNKEGRYTKWGKIFRSDDLYHLTDSDLKYLSSIPLVSIVDFRSAEEIQNAPDRNPASLKENYPYSINPGSLMSLSLSASNEKITPAQVDSMMMLLNRLLVIDPEIIGKYRDFFGLLQNENNIPLLFHCSAGKDRTGMAAALVLFALGVDEEVIFNDYLQSNQYLSGKYADMIAQNPETKSLFEVKPEFLQAGLAEIKKVYGSVEVYLTDILHVDLTKMKNMYLY